MISILEWLLDLENIRLADDAPILLRWDRHVDAWILFIVALAIIGLIVLTYRREQASLPRRIVPAVLRALVIGLVLALLCHPTLVLQQNRYEPSYVVLAIDTSQSMAIHEPYRDEILATAIRLGADLDEQAQLNDHSRLELVQASLLRDGAAPLRALLKNNSLQLTTFARHIKTLGLYDNPEEIDPLAMALSHAQPDGSVTDIPKILNDLITKSEGRRLAGIILVTDGQSTQPSSLKDAIDLASDRKIPIYPLRIGSTHPPRDIQVGPLRTQETVFLDDILAVEARVTVEGLTQPISLTVHLVDTHDERIVATEEITLAPDEPDALIELRTKPQRAGRSRYRVEIPPLAGEQNIRNNQDVVDLNIIDTDLRVLYVEGYPRYEYRFLKNALLREPTIQLSVLLIEADEQFVQEGTDPIRRFPETPEELNRFDVVLFGDVDPQGGWLTTAQMNMLLNFVGNEGGGFGLIAGERFAPHRFLGTPLSKLVPVRIDSAFTGRYDITITSGYQAVMTPEGRRSHLYRFLNDRRESVRMFEALPELFWIASTLGPTPGATVLLEHPSLRSPTGPTPLVVTGRYGAGKLFFQASDDTWRWRRHTGEHLHDTYWVRVARELMPQSRVSQNRRLVLRSDRRVYTYGRSVQIQAEFFDAQLLSLQDEQLTITVIATNLPEYETPDPFNDNHRGVTSRSVGGNEVVELKLFRLGAESSQFEGTWIPPRAGQYWMEASDITPLPHEPPAAVQIRVKAPNLEAKKPQADHDSLERIASATGGRVLNLDQLEAGFASLPDRRVLIANDITEPLWDSKLTLLLFALLITLEWGSRKWFNMT